MERYICIHGHFYQPPRENPWLEAIEVQDSAYPYHDWNERISAECYAPNGVARILDEKGKIARIANNYSRISFNFGPTLLAWLAARNVRVYQSILDADKESMERFSGHGSALAQAYNHMIMPLANRRDKVTQTAWGIQDFMARFGRKPEGMWLPETAVDTETLEVLAEQGMAFTILSPYQARRVRKLGDQDWRTVEGGQIDPTMAYVVQLPSGRKMNLFFYDGPISRAVAFEKLLSKGEHYAHRLTGAFSSHRDHPQMVHIATDGESYGHHHFMGDMGLAYALHYIETGNLARLTNYGEFLERHPPTHEVEIVEGTAWSCAHGVGRWNSDCGCNSGGHPGWNQKWRGPLREAFDWLRDDLTPLFEKMAGGLVRDPWAARDDYIQVILNRSDAALSEYLSRHAVRELGEGEKVTLLKLMELQRHAMLMYTSCGWFFDDVSGIETVQVIAYAGRALQLAEHLFGDEREAEFLRRLERAQGNVAEHGNGRVIYQKFVRPSRLNMDKLGAHFGVSSLFEKYPASTSVYAYTVEQQDLKRFDARRERLIAGRARFTSQITRETETLIFGVLHLGDHNIHCGVRKYEGDDTYQEAIRELSQAFGMADFPRVIRLLDRRFGESTYSIRSLFRDEQRKVLNIILRESMSRAEAHFRQVHERRVPLMRFLTDLQIPLPKAFHAAAEFTINTDLQRAFEAEDLDMDKIPELLEEAKALRVTLDLTTLEYNLRRNIEGLARRLATRPSAVALIERLDAAVALAQTLPFHLNLWTTQNLYHEMVRNHYAAFRKQADDGDVGAKQWLKLLETTGDRLGLNVAALGNGGK